MLGITNNDSVQISIEQTNSSDEEATRLIDSVETGNTNKIDKEEDATVLINNHNANVVDLGLSVNWCTCNLGATVPLSHGNFYILSSLKNLDAKTMNGLRLPTREEWNELIDKCAHEWKNGKSINFKGTNGKNIEIPVCGRYYDNEPDQMHETAFYWAAPNKYENKLWFTRMTENDASANNIIARTKDNIAMSIRLVQDK